MEFNEANGYCWLSASLPYDAYTHVLESFYAKFLLTCCFLVW